MAPLNYVLYIDPDPYTRNFTQKNKLALFYFNSKHIKQIQAKCYSQMGDHQGLWVGKWFESDVAMEICWLFRSYLCLKML